MIKALGTEVSVLDAAGRLRQPHTFSMTVGL
jgi:hypothetical protein